MFSSARASWHYKRAWASSTREDNGRTTTKTQQTRWCNVSARAGIHYKRARAHYTRALELQTRWYHKYARASHTGKLESQIGEK
jgi:hypothetical protein